MQWSVMSAFNARHLNDWSPMPIIKSSLKVAVTGQKWGSKPEVAAPNGPRSQLPPTLEFPSPNLEVSFPAAICPEWDSGDI